MTHSFISAARRSAVVPRNGAFAALDVHQLAATVVQQLLADAGVAPSEVGEIIVSNALGAGGNPARVVALAAGLPQSVAGLSIDRQCVGGLDTITLAGAMVKAGQHDIVIAGGVESYSRRPLRLRTFADGSEPEAYDQARFTPWPDNDPDMAEAADHLAMHLNIGRSEQDDWAIHSHHKAKAAPADLLRAEIAPVAGIAYDPFTRDLTTRHCAKAKRVHGTITAANMAVAADAAAFVLVVSKRVAARLQGAHVEVIAGATLGGDPTLPGLAPVAAIDAALTSANLTRDVISIAEIMEAFAVQAIACQRGAHLPEDIVNPYGGALARGHPVGASGAILAVRLYHALQRTGGTGVAAIAAAGGLGTALIMQSG